jgi:hypothetical protein
VDDEYVVTTRDAGGAEHEYRARAAAEAYGLALLALVRRAMAEVHAS